VCGYTGPRTTEGRTRMGLAKRTMYDAIFTPLKIAGITLESRVVRAAHGTRLIGEDLIAYHEERARGGVAMSILGAAGVHPTSETPDLPLHCDKILPLYEEMSERVHAHGMRLFQQLFHAGAAHVPRLGAAQWSASAVPNPFTGTVPRPMTVDEIEELVAAYAAAAVRVQDGGLDGVEVHAAHTYLIGQFLSPALNQREDEYGGSVENRTRILREILIAIRQRVGPDFPVGVRLVGDDFVPDGLRPADTVEIARSLRGLVDFVNLSLGGYWRFHQMLATMEYPLGYELDTNVRVARTIDVPTIVGGRILSLDHAEHIVASGQADLVSMVRALIADPMLVAKARAGHESLIRPCVGTNEGCEAGVIAGRFGCVVNIAAGRERRLSFEPDRAAQPRRVLVVGGGPAGLEVARTAALRGHEVELHEMLRVLGGQVLIAGSVPERADVLSYVKWLEDEIIRLGVVVRRGSPVTVDTVVEGGFDEVVLATGATPNIDRPMVMRPSVPVAGRHLPHVYTSSAALGFGGRAHVGTVAAVIDDTGGFEALTVALSLSTRCQVNLVTRFDALGGDMPRPQSTVGATRERLAERGVTVIPRHILTSIAVDHIVLADLDSRRETSHPADTVIMCGYREPNRELSDALREARVPHRIVGDANGGHSLMRAVREAAYLGRII
jgi:2,4-dienoyl-CoA reductase-like NADH-dependent reductase (Old Yellow Enzyme family)/thioredoxin reductase